MAWRRPARVSSGQRGNTGEVVTHASGLSVRHSQGQARLGRSGGTVCKCARAARAPPGRALVGLRRGRAGPLLSVSGLRGPRRVLPAAGVPRASRLPACHFSRRARPGPGRRRPGLPSSSRWRSGSGCWARTLPRAIESGLGAGAQRLGLPEARRLGGRLGPRLAGTTEAATRCPPCRRLDMERGSRSAGAPGACAVVGLPPAPDAALPPPPGPRATAAPAPSRRQDSLLRLLWVTAAPVNCLSDTRSRSARCGAGRATFRPTLALLGLAGEQIGVKYRDRDWAPRVGFIPLTNSGAWS